jgi:hypothetical protein
MYASLCVVLYVYMSYKGADHPSKETYEMSTKQDTETLKTEVPGPHSYPTTQEKKKDDVDVPC